MNFAGIPQRYLAGELPPVMRVHSNEHPGRLQFQRHPDGLVVATVPYQASPDCGAFRIEAALEDPMCRGLSFCRDGDAYRIELRETHLIYAVLKIASNHLNWIDFDQIEITFSEI